MANRTDLTSSRGKKRLAVGTGILILTMLAPMSGRAQAPAGERPAFEVASIKQHKGPRQVPMLANGRLAGTIPLLQLISVAYDLPFNIGKRLSGGPEWIREPDAVYDIEAEGPMPDGLSSSARMERQRLMMQALLADRFKLVIRRETKEMPAYVLLVEKGGPKLEKSDVDCSQAVAAGQVPCHQFMGGAGRGMHARAVTVGDLAHLVENWSDRPVEDHTGISGLYKVETQPFLPTQVAANPRAPGKQGEAGIDLADLPTLFQVVAKLGLQMKPQKAAVDTYVIESIERPGEN
jgi:uncharacterized protein (TIGR03435 family)